LLLSLLLVMPVYADSNKSTELSKFKEAKLKINEIIKSAKAGDVKSQLELGKMLDKGVWLKKDTKKAVMWWERAAEQGNVKAQMLMGTIYLAGQKVPKDIEKSNKWFNKAIESDADFIKIVNIMKARISKMEIKAKKHRRMVE